MKKAVSYIMTVPFAFTFGMILVVMHPVFLIGHLFGKGDTVMFWLNVFLNRSLLLTGVGIKQQGTPLPSDRPIIVVSNHQSMFDIPLFYEIMARTNGAKLKFIAKVELKHWVPSVSWVLRNLGSVLIKREDPRQSIVAIKKFGERLEREKLSVLLFPEGTRARDGALKKFQAPGLQALLRAAPSALIVPAVIDGAWELLQYKFWPVPFGRTITLQLLDPVEPRDYDQKKITEVVEERVLEALARIRGSAGDCVEQEASQVSAGC